MRSLCTRTCTRLPVVSGALRTQFPDAQIGEKMKSKFFLVLILVISATSFVLSQTDTARLIGTISDASGAVLPNAGVTVTNTGTGRTVTTETNGSGEYTVNGLSAGTYHLEVK